MCPGKGVLLLIPSFFAAWLTIEPEPWVLLLEAGATAALAAAGGAGAVPGWMSLARAVAGWAGLALVMIRRQQARASRASRCSATWPRPAGAQGADQVGDPRDAQAAADLVDDHQAVGDDAGRQNVTAGAASERHESFGRGPAPGIGRGAACHLRVEREDGGGHIGEEPRGQGVGLLHGPASRSHDSVARASSGGAAPAPVATDTMTPPGRRPRRARASCSRPISRSSTMVGSRRPRPAFNRQFDISPIERNVAFSTGLSGGRQ